MNASEQFLRDVADEMSRARILFPGQEDSLSLHEWQAIIAEEAGEIARALNERALDHIDEEMMLTALRDEVVQTAAMCGRMFAAVALARLRS